MSAKSLCYYLLLLVVHFSLSASSTAASKVSAIIVFGDSTVDPGNNNFIPTVAKSNFPPYGRDFDGGVATGRFSNGRLVTDFLSEAFGLPSSVPAYLDPSYTIEQLATGVSFASAGTGLDDLTAKIAVSKLACTDPSGMACFLCNNFTVLHRCFYFSFEMHGYLIVLDERHDSKGVRWVGLSSYMS
jgi:hypothetical protein